MTSPDAPSEAPAAWTPPPLPEVPEKQGGMLTMATAGTADEPTVDIAFRWSKLYANDFEYERFFDWVGRRSNPERTDFQQILESIPMTWGPEELPPPLRRFFLKKFGK